MLLGNHTHLYILLMNSSNLLLLLLKMFYLLLQSELFHCSEVLISNVFARQVQKPHYFIQLSIKDLWEILLSKGVISEGLRL